MMFAYILIMAFIITIGINTATHAQTTDSSKFSSPIKQAKLGVKPHEVQCNTHHLKLIKPNGDLSICVKQQTYEKLVERGWKEPLPCHGCHGAKFEKPSYEEFNKTATGN